MRFLVVIPVRMASTRLPGKPLADIAGEPMITHVWRRAKEADIGRVVIAAAEVALALGIVVRTFRNRATANVDEINLLKW